MHKLRWDDLQFVLAVAEAGSLSAAARTLGVNHATVLRRISTFEETIGVKLFDRSPGGYRPRPEAREIITALKGIGRTVGRLERLTPMIGQGFEGVFRLTTTDSVADIILAPRLVELAALHPKLAVDLLVTNAPIDMTRPDAEVTLRPASTMPDGLTGVKICDMAFRVYAAPDYLERNPSGDHQDHRWLGLSPPLTRSPVGAWQDAMIGDAVGFRADSFVTLARLAEAGLGPTMIPSFLGRSSSRLVQARKFPDKTTTSFWAATHPDLMSVPWIPPILEFFKTSISAERALME